MSKVVTKKSFWNDYKPLLVMGPVVVGLHWMWFKLQQNPKLVAKEEQLTELPIITVSIKFIGFFFRILFKIEKCSWYFFRLEGN